MILDWSAWYSAHRSALQTGTDATWNKLDTLMVELCNANRSVVCNLSTVVEAAILRLGGKPGVPPRFGHPSEVWQEHVLGRLWEPLNDVSLLADFDTGKTLALHSISPDGRLLNVSSGWCQLLDYRRADVLGRRSTEFLTPDSQLKAKHALTQFWRDGVIRADYEMVAGNGSVINVELSAVAERGANGTFQRSIAMLKQK